MANTVVPQGERAYAAGGAMRQPRFAPRPGEPGFGYGTGNEGYKVYAGERQQESQIGPGFYDWLNKQTDPSDVIKQLMTLAGYTGGGSGSGLQDQVPQELIDAQRALLNQQLGTTGQEADLARQMANAQLGGLDVSDKLTGEGLASQLLDATRQAGMDTNQAQNELAAQGASQSGMARQTLGSKWARENNTTDATRYGGSGWGSIADQLTSTQGDLYRQGQAAGNQSTISRLGFNQDITKAGLSEADQRQQLLYQLLRLNYVNAPNTALL